MNRTRNQEFSIHREERDGTFDQIIVRRRGYIDVYVPIIGSCNLMESRLNDKRVFDVLTQVLNNLERIGENESTH